MKVEEKTEEKVNKLNKKTTKYIIIITIIVILIISSCTILFYPKNKQKSNDTSNNHEIIEKIELELGNEIPTIDKFIKNYNGNGNIEIYFNDEKINTNKLNVIGIYEVKITIDNNEYKANIIVKDKEKPLLKTTDLSINKGQTYELNQFVNSCNDNSNKECILSFKTQEMKEYKEEGIYDIEICAKDESGNETINKVKLMIISQDDSNNETIQNNSNNENKQNNDESIQNNSVNNELEPENNPENNPNTSNNNFVNSVTKVNTTIEETSTTSYKYGTTITTITKTTYDIYSDGTKKQVNQTSTTNYDYQTFNGTTSQLKNEANELINNHASKINEVIKYVNQYRSEAGVENIIYDKQLSIAATIRALEMGWANQFSHTRPNGSSCFTVIDELGISYYAVGENIASGYKSPYSVANGWKNSPGHYSNMINSNFGKIGVGLAIVNGEYYWVQMFTN